MVTKPHNETARLDVLRSFQVLDTPPEQSYDDIVLLAAQICGAPIATITLVDQARQWFKAKTGLSVTETPREVSFCAEAIASSDDIFIIPDAQADPRFAGYANVIGDPHIRFYAGAPLVTRDGWALGTLCVIDRQPRELTAAQLSALRVLRTHVINSLELRRLVAAQRETIEQLESTERALRAARAEAEAATQAKSWFLAAMSHEIRTPMNAVLGMTMLLSETPLSPEQADSVETLRSSGELLLALVNDVLDFSKIEAGQLELERAPFSPTACIAQSVGLIAAQAAARGLKIETVVAPGVPAAVTGDCTRVRQILLNLLSNALKFTEQGGVTVSLSARPVAAGALELHYQVRDTGMGIPSDRLDRLFKDFSQVDASTARRFGGTGLGLAISRRLAELHGGRIWVESEAGRGSCFQFTIVATPAAAPLPAPAPSAQPIDAAFAAAHPARLLVVEDSLVSQKIVLKMLQKIGYEPALAGNGQEALSILRERDFDIVLMDVEMPGLDGPATTRQMRQEHPANRQPVVIALTAHALPELRARFLAAGMDDYLSKPLRLAELTAALARCVDLKRSRVNLPAQP